MGVEPLEEHVETQVESRESFALAGNRIVGLTGCFVEREDVEGAGVIPRTKLDEILGRFEFDTEHSRILLAPSELVWCAAEFVSVGCNPRRDVVRGGGLIFIHGVGAARPDIVFNRRKMGDSSAYSQKRGHFNILRIPRKGEGFPQSRRRGKDAGKLKDRFKTSRRDAGE